MDERINREAALANLTSYTEEHTHKYAVQAPHIKHASLRALHTALVSNVYNFAKQYSATPRVLDLGAGEGSVTFPFLDLGAKVTVVDISKSQLDELQRNCDRFGDRLEVRCQDIWEMLNTERSNYDIVVANSFLHHVPDYVSMIAKATALLTPNGQFFSFQDPLRYDSVGKGAMIFSDAAYISWRIFQGDVLRGAIRRLRRSRGIYLADSVHDNVEYHVIRNGVDQDAICRFLRDRDFECDVISYFSTPSRFFQSVGTTLGVKNTFAIIAQRQNRVQ